MFDIGWSEMAVIALLALIVLGPKDLPKAMQTVAHWVRKARAVAREFQSGIDDMMREAELDEAKKTIESARNFDVRRNIEDSFDPTGEVSEEARELERAARSDDAGDGGESAKTERQGAAAEEPRAEIRKSPLQVAPGNSVTPPVENGQDASADDTHGRSSNGATEPTAAEQDGGSGAKGAAAKTSSKTSSKTPSKTARSKANSAGSASGKSASGKSASGKSASRKGASRASGGPKATAAKSTTGKKSSGKTASTATGGRKSGRTRAAPTGGKGNA